MLEIRNCPELGQQGVYATADIAAGTLFVGRNLLVRFNARRHAQGGGGSSGNQRARIYIL